MPSNIKELDQWIVDFDYQDACRMVDGTLFEYYSTRVNPYEKTITYFKGLPTRLQDYLKARWPNNKFGEEE